MSHKIFRNLALIALALIACTALATSTKRPPESQYWPATGISWKILSTNFLTQKNCMTEYKNFVGCVRALQRVVAQNTPPQMLIPKALANPDLVKIIKHDFGALVVAEFKYDPFAKGSVRENNNLKRLYYEKDLKELEKLYQAQKKTKKAINFEALTKSIGAAYLSPKNAAAETASAINEYYRNAEDPHTYISPTAFLDASTEALDQKLVGIGLKVRALGDRIQITEPIRGGPADIAGLKAGDILYMVDDQIVSMTDGLSAEQIATEMLQGKEGTPVEVQILREKVLKTFSIIRAVVEVRNIQSWVVSDTGKPIGYIKISTFNDDHACEDTAQAIKSLEAKGVMGLIIDTRNNGGGKLKQALCMTSLFIGKKLIVSAIPLNGKEGKQDGTGENDAISALPLFILQNGYSASASEIFAGDLQFYQRAWIVGDRSFGKGSVQRHVQWAYNPKITFVETIARYYLPDGRSTQSLGIAPNFNVPFKPFATADEVYVERELDKYPNAMPVQGPRWQEPRPEAQKAIKKCVDSFGRATQNYDTPRTDNFARDYQLAWAQDAMVCASAGDIGAGPNPQNPGVALR